MIPNPNKTKTIKTNASSDAARVCVPIVDKASTINVLGEFGWEPLPAKSNEIPSQPRSHLEHSPVTSNGNGSRVSDERVKDLPSSAQPCPPGIGDMTAQAVRADTCYQSSTRQRSYHVSPANQSGTSHCCIISAAAPAVIPKGKRLLMDTGCGYDLTDEEFAALFAYAIETSTNIVSLHTANALVETSKTLAVWIEQV